MKKLLLGLGALATITAPIASVVSCGKTVDVSEFVKVNGSTITLSLDSQAAIIGDEKHEAIEKTIVNFFNSNKGKTITIDFAGAIYKINVEQRNYTQYDVDWAIGNAQEQKERAAINAISEINKELGY